MNTNKYVSKASGMVGAVYSSRTGRKDAKLEEYTVGWKQTERQRRVKVELIGFPCINSPLKWWPYRVGRNGGHD